MNNSYNPCPIKMTHHLKELNILICIVYQFNCHNCKCMCPNALHRLETILGHNFITIKNRIQKQASLHQQIRFLMGYIISNHHTILLVIDTATFPVKFKKCPCCMSLPLLHAHVGHVPRSHHYIFKAPVACR